MLLRALGDGFILEDMLQDSGRSAGTSFLRWAGAPVAEFQDQESLFGRAFALLTRAIDESVFPCAVVAITLNSKLIGLKALGKFDYDKSSPPAAASTVFDLASVSKVVATTSMAMILYERGLLDLEMPIAGVFPEFARGQNVHDPQRAEVTIHQLLSHSSGLPGYERLYLHARTRDELLAAAFAVPLKRAPGTKAEYSDIGFIVLGAALEKIADEPLDQFCSREVFSPLGMMHTTFNPAAQWKSNIPPTADDTIFRRRVVQGEVQDENASVMGGVAGHAGLFSSAGDVAVFADAILRGGGPIVRAETLTLFTRRNAIPAGTSRAFGWDTPSSPSQSGKYFSPTSFGHLGYTGTSLWIDPERQLSITLLTNRTWPDCKNQAIKEVRPRFHDAVVEALQEKQLLR